VTDAASVTLNLDHVLVECATDGNVMVRFYDVGTMTLSVWVMRQTADGWHMRSTAVPIDPRAIIGGELSIH